MNLEPIQSKINFYTNNAPPRVKREMNFHRFFSPDADSLVSTPVQLNYWKRTPDMLSQRGWVIVR